MARYTFATRALVSGIDVLTVTAILGLRNTSTTLKYYAQQMSSARKDALDKMGSIMSWEWRNEAENPGANDPQTGDNRRDAKGNME